MASVAKFPRRSPSVYNTVLAPARSHLSASYATSRYVSPLGISKNTVAVSSTIASGP